MVSFGLDSSFSLLKNLSESENVALEGKIETAKDVRGSIFGTEGPPISESPDISEPPTALVTENAQAVSLLRKSIADTPESQSPLSSSSVLFETVAAGSEESVSSDSAILPGKVSNPLPHNVFYL